MKSLGELIDTYQDYPKKGIDFKDVIKNNDMIKKNLNDLEVELLFDTEYFLKYVDQIFKRLELS